MPRDDVRHIVCFFETAASGVAIGLAQRCRLTLYDWHSVPVVLEWLTLVPTFVYASTVGCSSMAAPLAVRLSSHGTELDSSLFMQTTC
jgi:hypothetical protein